MHRYFIRLKSNYYFLLVTLITNCATETEGLALMTDSFKKRVESKFLELDKKYKKHDVEFVTQKQESNKKYSLLQEKNNILEKQLKEDREEIEKKIKEEIEYANSEKNKEIIHLNEEKLKLKYNLDIANENLNTTNIALQTKEKELTLKSNTLNQYESSLQENKKELLNKEKNLNNNELEKKRKEEELEKLKKEKLKKEKIEKEIERIEKVRTNLYNLILQNNNSNRIEPTCFAVIDYLFEVLKNFIIENNNNSTLLDVKKKFITYNSKKIKEKCFNFASSNDLLSKLFELDSTLSKINSKNNQNHNDKNIANILYSIYLYAFCGNDTKNQNCTKKLKIEQIDQIGQSTPKYKILLVDKDD